MAKISLNGSDWICKEYLDEDWIWRNGEKTETRDVRWWKPARVPGSVTDDLWRCREIVDPYFEKNSLSLEWIPQRTWIYRKEFTLQEDMEGCQVHLCFEGVDYEALFYLNDVYLGTHCSMYTPVEFDVTKILKKEGKNLLAVVIKKAPNEESQVSKTRYVKTHKSRMTYWWDFCPRMIHLGIWDDVYLEITGTARLGRPNPEIRLNETFTKAEASFGICVWADCRMRAELLLEGSVVAEQVKQSEKGQVQFDFLVENPRLWWPNGYGEQPLYTLVLTAETKEGISHSRQVRFGIRDVKFVKNETGDADARPYTACVNGRKIYMKGYNWVPMDVMYGVRRKEKLERLIGLLKEAHVNCLRIWGGGLIEREDFYDLCDENGIMLWQEFIQSSSGIENEPSSDPAFLQRMEEEAAVIIPRKKHHPSLVLWGGGNELSGPENGMITMDVPVIGVLGRQVKKLDPSRYFLESSPTGRMFNNTLENIAKDPAGLHDVHGPWEHQGLTEQYTLYNAGTSLLSSEFGVEGMTNYDTLTKGMEKSHLWPPSRENDLYFHRGSWWNNYPLLQKCFGEKLTEIRQTVRASQFMQYEGLKYAVESNRRRAFSCSGTFPWQFNEPYPNNTCTCSVDYYAAPKPAYYGVRKAYASDVVTARFSSMTLQGLAALEAEIFWQSGRKENGPAAFVVKLVEESGRICAEKILPAVGVDHAEAEKAVRAGSIRCPVEKIGSAVCYLFAEARDEKGGVLAENSYLFTRTDLAPLLELEETAVEAVLTEESGVHILKLTNTGSRVAAGLWMEDERALEAEKEGYLYFSENYLYLLPGQQAQIVVRSAGGKHPCIRISAFNVKEMTVTDHL